jgi:hypothetical protein
MKTRTTNPRTLAPMNAVTVMVGLIALALVFGLPLNLEAKPGKKGRKGKKHKQGTTMVVVDQARPNQGNRNRHRNGPRIGHGSKHVMVVTTNKRARRAAKRRALRAAIRDTRDRIERKEWRLAELRSVFPRGPYVRARIQRVRARLNGLYAELDDLRFRLQRQRRIARMGHWH